MNTNKTKIIVQAGLFVAIYSLFFLLNRYMGGYISSFLYFLLPLPLIIFTVDYGYKYALIPATATLLIGLLIDPINTLLYILGANILGIIYGELVRQHKSNIYLLLSCFIAELVIEILTGIIFAGFLDYSISEEILSLFTGLTKLLHINISDPLIMNRIVYTALPVYLFVVAIIEGYCVHVFATLILKKLNIRDNGIGRIYLMCLPKSIGIFYTFSFLLHLLTLPILYKSNMTILVFISGAIADLFWFNAILLSFQALITGVIYFSRKPKTKYLYILFLIILFIIPLPAIIIYSIIGLIIVFKDIHKYLLYNNK